MGYAQRVLTKLSLSGNTLSATAKNNGNDETDTVDLSGLSVAYASSAGNADTVDNIHGTELAKKSDGIITNITFSENPSLISGGNDSVEMRISRTTGNNYVSSYAASLDVVYLHKLILEFMYRTTKSYVTIDVYISNSNDITVNDCYWYLRHINTNQNSYYPVNGVRGFSSGVGIIWGCYAKTSTSIIFLEYGSTGNSGLDINNSDITIASQKCIKIAHLKY